MKFLFDQNISHRILRLLPENSLGSSHVKKEGLINAPDIEIWRYAKKHDFIIVTQDSDFNDLNSFYGFPPKIVWLRIGNLSTRDIVNTLQKNHDNIQQFLDDESHGCFEIVKIDVG